MKVLGLSFPEDVSPGVSVRLDCGQEYHLVKREPYVRKDGRASQLLVWSTICPDTGEEFEVKTARSFDSFPARRAPGARTGGKVRAEVSIPTIDAYELPRSQMAFWCPYCRKVHLHGLPEGHRLAHCHVPSSPYLERGYILRVVGKVDSTKKIKKMAA